MQRPISFIKEHNIYGVVARSHIWSFCRIYHNRLKHIQRFLNWYMNFFLLETATVTKTKSWESSLPSKVNLNWTWFSYRNSITFHEVSEVPADSFLQLFGRRGRRRRDVERGRGRIRITHHQMMMMTHDAEESADVRCRRALVELFWKEGKWGKGLLRNQYEKWRNFN